MGQPCESQWDTGLSSVTFNGMVRAALPVGDDLCVAGVFTSIDGEPRARIAMLSGGQWLAMGPGFNNQVFDLIVFDDAVHAVGTFTASGLLMSRIARWTGEAWSPLGAGLNSHALAMHSSDIDGEEALYVGGPFTTAGGVSAVGIAKWDGETWSGLGAGLQGSDKAALAMVQHNDGSGEALFVGGSFLGAGGQVSPNIVTWDGESWSPVGAGLDGIVRALAVFRGELIAGGEFTHSGAAEVKHLARWTGEQWETFAGGAEGVVNALHVIDTPTGERLVVGGYFNVVGGINSRCIGMYDGASWSALGEGVNSAVNSIARMGDDLIIGCDVAAIGGGAAPALRRWTLCLSGPSGDLTGDGLVNGSDLAALLAQWGQSGPADLTGDGVVNGADLATLLSNWT